MDFKGAVREMVYEHARKNGIRHRSVWGRLYAELLTCHGINVYPRILTSRSSPKPAQVLDVMDVWDRVYDTAKKLFGKI